MFLLVTDVWLEHADLGLTCCKDKALLKHMLRDLSIASVIYRNLRFSV